MAELTAIGWVVSPMIKKMMDKIPSYIMGRYRWDTDMKKDLEKLQKTLDQIQVVVDKAKGWHTMGDSQKQLLRQLRDAAYEADDLLDEFEYQDMEERAKVAEGTVSHVMFSSVKFGKRLIGQDELRNNLTEILKKLEDVKEAADLFVKIAGVEKTSAAEQVEISSSRVTGSILSESKIVGRDKEKDEIVCLLLKSITDEPESSYTNIHVIPIIGNGGIGKTTLAQIIYNDQKIKDQFPLRMWICVSDNFDEIKLTKEILQCVSKSDEKLESIMNFDMLQQKLQSKLKTKRFLLVLDDVWPDEKKGEFQNEEMWKKLLAPLQGGVRGSKILVTTRMKIVAKIFGATNPIFLEGLKKDEMWSLLKKYAFGNENPDNYQELNEIGTRIAERLKGSPLACKVVGSMLRDRLDATKWKEILEREMVDDVMSILRLSYQRLPDHLKQCFTYCSIFPKNWLFEAEKLVHLWIAQDYIEIPVRNDRRLVDVGIDYFNELLCRSFFQKVERNFGTYHVIHDLMHDLAESVSTDECFRIDHKKQREIMQPVQHLGVVINNEGEFRDFVVQWEKTSNFKNLRTLIFFRASWMKCTDLPLSFFKELKSLRVLDFGYRGPWKGIVPKSIGNLTHLRYLHLSFLTYCLPESLSKLYHLQVLAAYAKLSFCGSMTELIKFGKLAQLDAPNLEFRVEKNEGHGIGVLKDMVVVARGKLQISCLENVTSKEEATEANLGSKQHLGGLELLWSSERRNEWRQETDEEVAEALKPHSNLKLLRIFGFRGIRSPSWLEMKWMINLQTIHLYKFRCLEVLPPLGHLPSLKELTIGKMDAVKGVGSEFYGVVDDSDEVRGFPSLELLVFENMPEWLEWCGADFPVFPRLRELQVDNCPKLMRFDGFRGIKSPSWLERKWMINLQTIDLFRCRCLEVLPPLGHLPSLKKLRIWEMDAVKGVGSEFYSVVDDSHGVRGFPSLEVLVFKNMPEWLEWCGADFPVFPRLRELRVYNCPKLMRFPLFPPTLTDISISDTALIFDMKIELLQQRSSCQHFRLNLKRSIVPPSAIALLHGNILAAIEELRITNCTEPIPAGCFHKLAALRRLKLISCQESLVIDALPASLKSLRFNDCRVTERWVSGCLQGLTSLSDLKIQRCAGLTSLPSAQVLQRLIALQKLQIMSCEELTSLGALHCLPSLKVLGLYDCLELKSLPEEGLPASIEVLFLSNSHPALMQQMREKKGPEWDKVARIPQIEID